MNERRNSRRSKSFLRGLVYVSRKRGGLACLVRDLSDKGARIIFSDNVTLPDVIDLHIPQRERTLRARVQWRRGDEIGLGFIDAERAAEVEPTAAEVAKRGRHAGSRDHLAARVAQAPQRREERRRRRSRGLNASPRLLHRRPDNVAADRHSREKIMPKAYCVATYRSISNPDALAEYAKLAGPAISAAGGRFLARGTAAKAYEKGVMQRTVIVEFDSLDKAVARMNGAGYQAALKALGNAVERDLRIVEGVA